MIHIGRTDQIFSYVTTQINFQYRKQLQQFFFWLKLNKNEQNKNIRRGPRITAKQYGRERDFLYTETT